MSDIEIKTPFDLLKNITNKTGYIHDSSIYSKHMYLVTQFLSYHQPYIGIMDEVNKSTYTDVQTYDFLYSMIPKGYIKIIFPKKNNYDKIQVIMDYYDYNKQKAHAIEPLITDADIIDMKRSLEVRQELGYR